MNKLKELEAKVKTDFPIPYISKEDIEEIIGEKEYKKFGYWMSGQTCITQGYYWCDVQNYFRNKERGTLDDFPHGF